MSLWDVVAWILGAGLTLLVAVIVLAIVAAVARGVWLGLFGGGRAQRKGNLHGDLDD